MRRLLGMLVVMLTMGGLLAFVAPPAMACSCVGTTDQQAYDDADVVFEGRVLEKTYPDATDEYPAMVEKVLFKVREVHKGQVGDGRARVRTGSGGDSCGFDFRKDRMYVVYADRKENGRLWTDACSGTRRITGAGPTFDGS